MVTLHVNSLNFLRQSFFVFVFFSVLILTWAVIFTFKNTLVCTGNSALAKDEKEQGNSSQCILHSFFYNSCFSKISFCFPDAVLPAALSVSGHLLENICPRRAQKRGEMLNLVRDVAAGWYEALQEN